MGGQISREDGDVAELGGVGAQNLNISSVLNI